MGCFEVVELHRLDQFTGVRLGPEDLAVAGDRNDEVLIEGHTAVRTAETIDLVGARIHRPSDPGIRRVVYVDPVDGAEAIDDIHEAVVHQRRALVAAQRDEPYSVYPAQRHSEHR